MFVYPQSTVQFASSLLKRVLTSAALVSVGVLGTLQLTQATEIPQMSPEHAARPSLTAANSTTVRSLLDGIYLYGQSPRPNQIGKAYIVLQVKDDRVAGAFYMPSSSFDCFQGELRGHQLALTVTNSDEQSHYPYLLPLQEQAAQTKANPAPITKIPAGYHAISWVSDRDRQILATCQAANLP